MFILGAASTVIMPILAIIPIIGWIIDILLPIAIFVFWIINIVNAAQANGKALPFIGNIENNQVILHNNSYKKNQGYAVYAVPFFFYTATKLKSVSVKSITDTDYFYAISLTMTAFCACRRFSASSNISFACFFKNLVVISSSR